MRRGKPPRRRRLAKINPPTGTRWDSKEHGGGRRGNSAILMRVRWVAGSLGGTDSHAYVFFSPSGFSVVPTLATMLTYPAAVPSPVCFIVSFF